MAGAPTATEPFHRSPALAASAPRGVRSGPLPELLHFAPSGVGARALASIAGSVCHLLGKSIRRSVGGEIGRQGREGKRGEETLGKREETMSEEREERCMGRKGGTRARLAMRSHQRME